MTERFFVTCMEKNGSTHYLTKSGKDSGWPDFGEEYLYGYFSTFDEVLKSINEDARSVFMETYEYVLIEKMSSGIHPICMDEDRRWFKYNEEINQYEATKEVENLHVCNWALG